MNIPCYMHKIWEIIVLHCINQEDEIKKWGNWLTKTNPIQQKKTRTNPSKFTSRRSTTIYSIS